MGRIVSEQPDEPLPFLAHVLERKATRAVSSGGEWATPPSVMKQEAVLKAIAVRSPLPVMSPILPPQVMLFVDGGVQGAGGSRVGDSGGRGLGRGQHTFHAPCHVLHYHLVLRPKGTSHNQEARGEGHMPKVRQV